MARLSNAKFEFVEESGQHVAADRFVNPDGTIGGWVAINAIVEEGAYVDAGAVVPPLSYVKKGEHIKAEEILSIESDE